MTADTSTFQRVRDEWNEQYGAPEGADYRGGHRAPEGRAAERLLGRDAEVSPALWLAIGAMLVAFLLAAGLVVTAGRTAGPVGVPIVTELGQGGGLPAARTASFGWSTPPGRVSDRVIELVDRIPGNRWNVAAAERWLDRFTTSEMRVVKRCSGKAYRCIIVKRGKVQGDSVGWTQGGVITIDTAKAARRPEYRRAAVRKWLIAHELGHVFGLPHTPRQAGLMNPTPGPGRLSLSAPQRVHLAAR